MSVPVPNEPDHDDWRITDADKARGERGIGRCRRILADRDVDEHDEHDEHDPDGTAA